MCSAPALFISIEMSVCLVSLAALAPFGSVAWRSGGEERHNAVHVGIVCFAKEARFDTRRL